MEQRDERDDKLAKVLESIENYRLIKGYEPQEKNLPPIDDRDKLLLTLSQLLQRFPAPEAHTREDTALCLSLLRSLEAIQFQGTLGRVQRWTPHFLSGPAHKVMGDRLFHFSECLPRPYRCHLLDFSDTPVIQEIPTGPFKYSTMTNMTSALHLTQSHHLHTVVREIHDFLSERLNQVVYHHTFPVNEDGCITQPEILESAAEGLSPYRLAEDKKEESSCFMDYYRGGNYIKNFDWDRKKKHMLKLIAGQEAPVINLQGQSQETFTSCMDAFVLTVQNTSEADRALLKSFLLRHGGQSTTHIPPYSTMQMYGLHSIESAYAHICWGLSEDREHFEAEIIYVAVGIMNMKDGNVYVLDANNERCLDRSYNHQKLLSPLLQFRVRVRLDVEDNAVCPKITHYEITSYAKELAMNPEYVANNAPTLAPGKK